MTIVEARELAWSVTLEPDATIDNALETWSDEYERVVGRSPIGSVRAAALLVLEQRISGKAPPLPPSASSSSWAIPPDVEFAYKGKRMNDQEKLRSSLSQAMEQVPGCIACACTHLDHGLLGYVQKTNHADSILQLTSAALMEQFEGNSVRTIYEKIAEVHGPVADDAFILGMSFVTPHTLHVMVRGGKGMRYVVTYVCKSGTVEAMAKARGTEAAKGVMLAAG